MVDAARARSTYAEYLAALASSEARLEWHAGEIRAMAGGTIEHARLTARVIAALSRGLRGRPCEVYSPDLRIRIEAIDRTLMPDASIVCGPVETPPDDANAATNPTVIVEVLSDSSEPYDRGEKFRHYRRLTTFREYVLVSQREPLIEVFRREGTAWTITEHGPGDELTLASVSATLAVDDVYGRAPG